jgi:hypothetical protein
VNDKGKGSSDLAPPKIKFGKLKDGLNLRMILDGP